MDSRDWARYLRVLQQVERQWTTAYRENLPSGCLPFIPMQLGDFMLLLTEAVLAATGPRFLDVGCGPGTKVWLAETLGLDAAGLDVQAACVAEANRGRAVPVAELADARTWDGYGGFDIVFVNRPVDGQGMPVFERMVLAAVRPGAVLILANGYTDPGEEYGWLPVYIKTQAPNPVTGVWVKPGEAQLRAWAAEEEIPAPAPAAAPG